MICCLVVIAGLGARAAAAPEAPVSPVAPTSKLAYPAGADLWVDVGGADSISVTNPPGNVTKVAVLVFAPKGNNLDWDGLTSLYVEQRLLPAAPKAEFGMRFGPAVGSAANEEEVNAYKPTVEGQMLVLGLIRNLMSRNQLAYAVLLTGKLTNSQAVTVGRAKAQALAELARELREKAKGGVTPPAPAPVPSVIPSPPGGSVQIEPIRLITGPGLAALLQKIQQSALISARVKEMSRVVIPQATSVRLYTWRTSLPMTDQQFVAYYTSTAQRLGWGQPISRDDRAAAHPTLLFQMPNNAGVAMVRAQPSPVISAPGRGPTVEIFLLVMEGRINASALRGQ